MPEDLEVGVRLVPDTSELEDVEDRELDVSRGQTGGGGGGTGAAAGGFAGAETGELLGRGTIVAGLLAGILSQLKPVAQFVKLIFRILGRAILPVIQLLIVALRPLLTNLAKTNAAVNQPGKTFGRAASKFQRQSAQQGTPESNILSGLQGVNPVAPVSSGVAGIATDVITDLIDSEPSTTDHTDEGKKNQQANLVKDVLELIP